MVRVRKNANTLTPGERDRFVAAFAQLNNQGAGRFADFRDMHTAVSSPQAHGAPGFLPWHRAYLLDLERELQAIDPSVSLPYWRFDQPAPNIFTRDFFGVSDPLGTVQFSATNPLQFWRTDGVQGINRRPFFNTAAAPPGLRTEAQTLALGNSVPSVPDHGRQPARIGAHQLRRFHLQHRDRRARSAVLPASLQRRSALGEVAATESAASIRRRRPRTTAIPGTRSATTCPTRCGRGMGSPERPRPPTAPGGAMAASPCVSAPGPQPRVRDCLDYQGSVNAVSRMGFDYDDVPFA